MCMKSSSCCVLFFIQGFWMLLLRVIPHIQKCSYSSPSMMLNYGSIHSLKIYMGIHNLTVLNLSWIPVAMQKCSTATGTMIHGQKKAWYSWRYINALLFIVRTYIKTQFLLEYAFWTTSWLYADFTVIGSMTGVDYAIILFTHCGSMWMQ